MSGFALAAALAQGPNVQPMIVSDLTGTLRIEQPIPCTDDVDQTTPVTGGRIEMSPSEGVDVAGGAKTFVLNRVSVSFAAFSIHRPQPQRLGGNAQRLYRKRQTPPSLIPPAWRPWRLGGLIPPLMLFG